MHQIDKLIIKAQNVVLTHSERFIHGFVTHNTDMGIWLSTSCLWDGKRSSGTRRIIGNHQTMEAAIEAVERVAEEYPNEIEDTTIIIDDIPG